MNGWPVKIFIPVFLSIALPFPSMVLCAPLPHACTDAPPPLLSTDTSVTTSYPKFSYRNNNYPIEIRGLIQSRTNKSSPPYSLCKRYEIDYKTGAKIKDLRWPDVGLDDIGDISSPSSLVWSIPEMNDGLDTVERLTTLWAWENSPAKGVTTYPVLVEAKTASNGSAIGTLMKKQYVRALSEEKVSNLSSDFEANIPKFSDEHELPPLKSSLKLNQLSVEATSSVQVFPNDNYAETSIKVTANWNGVNTGSFFAPGLSASSATKINRNSVAADYVKAYIKQFSMATPLEISSGQPLTFKFDFKLSGENDRSGVFVVKQPLSLITKERTICITVPVYVPAPIHPLADAVCPSGAAH